MALVLCSEAEREVYKLTPYEGVTMAHSSCMELNVCSLVRGSFEP